MGFLNVIGGVNSYKAFYNDCKGKLFGYLLKVTGDYHLAADIMQESFTRYLERYGDQDPNQALLFRIARNLMVDNLRRRGRQASVQPDQVEDSRGQEHRLLIRQEARRVLEAMEKLDTQQREILSLVVESGMSYSQIASLMGLTEANVKVKVHRARMRLRKYLMEGEQCRSI